MIRAIIGKDQPKVLALAKRLGFTDEELDVVHRDLSEANSSQKESRWFAAENDNGFVGVLYCAAEVMTNGTWNALMLLVSPDSHGQGFGRELMQHAEQELLSMGARLLIVETSSLDDFERARMFYEKAGYIEEGRISEFYDAGEDKIVFAKKLVS